MEAGCYRLIARNSLTLIAPEGFAGVFTLDAQLLSADARTPLSDDVSFRVEVKGAGGSKGE